jgi:hypothetical protein
MKKKSMLYFILIIALRIFAGTINLNPDPDGEPWVIGGIQPLTYEQQLIVDEIPLITGYNPAIQLPYSVDNSQHRYFRDIFNQQGGSCAQAAGIGYIFTYEINRLRDIINPDPQLYNAKFNPDNQYPTHYTYNFLNSGDGDLGSWYYDGWDIISSSGVPNVTTYGGMTPSNDTETMHKIWMTGFDKYKSGMPNRVLKQSRIKVNTPEGLNTLKNHLHSHGNGSQIGGLAAMSAYWQYRENELLPEGTENEGDYLIREFCYGSAHAVTIIGYNDSIRFDFNNDGYYTHYYDENDELRPMTEWEKGGVLIANSHGTLWPRWFDGETGDNWLIGGGKAWVSYRTLALGMETGGIFYDEVAIIDVVDNTLPSLYLKADITSSKRDKLKIMAGVSNDATATEPDYTIEFPCFNYQGGEYGMAGNGDTIELGLDISDLLNYPLSENSRIFLSIEHNDDDGEVGGFGGRINSFSVIDNQNNVSSLNNSHTIVTNTTTNLSVLIPCTQTPMNYYVNNDRGNDFTYDGLSETAPFMTLSRAIKAATAGSTIFLAGNSDEYPTAGTFTLSSPEEFSVVRSGIYSGLPVTKELHFIGQSPENTIVQSDVNPGVSTHRVFLLKSDESVDFTITFENMAIRNGMGEPGGGIFSRNVDEVILKNCHIYNNYYLDDPDASTERGGGGICVSSGSITIENCVIRDNQNNVRNGGAGLYCYLYDKREIKIINSSIINNSSSQSGGGIRIDLSVPISEPSHDIEIRNSTIANNFSNNGFGHGIYINCGIIRSDIDLNSCTIVDNFNPSEPLAGYGISIQSTYTSATSPPTSLNVSNSIIKNNANNYRRDGTIGFDRSYTICDDNSLPLGSDPQEFNELDPMITGYGNEDNTYYYKIIAGSPAKDAIPIDEDDEGNPFNGAGIYVVDEETGDPILDEYGNIQVLDQRGFNVWNQRKDIGAYESPYYWVDVTEDDANYTTIPNWRTKLTIADPVEGWTDYMRAQTGGTIILSDNSEIIREEGSELHWYDGSYMDVEGDARIRNGIDFVSNANVNILDGDQLALLNSNTTIPASASFKIGNDSKFVLEGESAVTFANGLNIESDDNAEIVLYGPSSLNADGVTFSYTGTEGGKWLGINCNSESFVDLNNVHITGAVTGVKGFYNKKFEVTNSILENCDNGIMVTELVDNVNYVITGNSLTGTSSGTGVSITDSNGRFRDNSITLFYVGANFTLCSPEIAKNTIEYNKAYGILISGQNAIPQLINTDLNQVYNELNNTVANNGNTNLGTLIFPSSQIGIRPYSNVYMQNGHNNVYRGEFNTLPAVPCMSIENKVSQITSGIIVNAQNNFWGSYDVTDDFFDGHTQYSIVYEPYSANPYPLSDTNSNNPQSSQTTENKILTNAMKLEDKGNYRAAINLYELVIRKYEDSPEYYVAMARLPYLYSMLEEDNNILIAAYDEAYKSENTTNKKFFKGMKVAAHIKGKRYDDAIIVAEEMKNEAEFEEEIILADINIAIANKLKNLNSKGKSKNAADDIQTLISKLTGNGEKNEPADISKTLLPEKTVLHQNYPNPFNPVTQIKFDLAKTCNVKLNIYNVSGQKIAELADGIRNAGFHTVEFDGSKFNSGIYYYTLEVDGKNITKKMVLTK